MSYDNQHQQGAQNALNTKASRIQSDAQRLRSVAEHLTVLNGHIAQHARSLGYFQDTPAVAQEKVRPISTTMADSIGDVERAVEDIAASLRAFD